MKQILVLGKTIPWRLVLLFVPAVYKRTITTKYVSLARAAEISAVRRVLTLGVPRGIFTMMSPKMSYGVPTETDIIYDFVPQR